MKITILGCGASAGVPVVGRGIKGGFWGNCDPENPKNRRTRASIMIEHEGKIILIDTSPDLRQQILPLGLEDIDAVLFTHEHADHTHGIDELKVLYNVAKREAPYPIYGPLETLEDLKVRFFYLFKEPNGHFREVLEPHEIVYGTPFQAAGLDILPFKQDHARSFTAGYRIGNVAYSTDVKTLDDQAFEYLKDLDLWVVDCISDKPAPTHSHLEQTLEWIERASPKRAILTHMSGHLDYDTLKAQLPPHIEPAYDGMVVEV